MIGNAAIKKKKTYLRVFLKLSNFHFNVRVQRVIFSSLFTICDMPFGVKSSNLFIFIHEEIRKKINIFICSS